MDVKITLPLLPLRDIVVFPSMVIPLFVGRDKSISALNEVMKKDKKIILVTQKNSEIDDPKKTDIFMYGCEGNILQLLKLPDGTVKVLVEGIKRVKILDFKDNDKFITCEYTYYSDVIVKDEDLFPLAATALRRLEKLTSINKKVSSETINTIKQLKDPSQIADNIASHITATISEKQLIFETADVKKRLNAIIKIMESETSIIGVEKRIRGRANTLRLALSNQLPEGSFASKEMYETMELCVSCKACQRECPMSVDMAKMKSEFLSHYYKKFSMRIKDRITSEMPRLIWLLKIIAPIFNKIKNFPLISSIVEKFGFAVERNMPEVQNQNTLREIYNDQTFSEKKVILFADTFNVNFENQNLIYSIKVLNKFGYQAIIPSFGKDKLDRPLCCGRTYISYGQLDKASKELNRFNDYIINNNYFNLPVVGIEPSCLLTFNDEYQKLKNVNNREKIKNKFYLLEEFILEQIKNDNKVKTNKFDQNVLIHGHCHQKSQDRMKGLTNLLSELKINNKMIDSSCCGMAGSFGYDSKNYEVSKKMANLSLIPAINNSDEADFIIANGTSCRHQISDLSHKKGKHVSELLFKIFETVN